ncbi:MAG: Rha family transcriptional regulator [Janthinobacterium lividum]
MSILVYPSSKGHAITNSRRVAKGFGRKHKNVLRAIDKLECDAQFSRLNFKPSTYLDQRGKEQREVLMTRAGFAFLIMGFTGQRAAGFKQDYIRQFDQMETLLKGPQQPATPLNELTQPAKQVELVKQVVAQLYKFDSDPNDIMRHHRGVMKCLTALTPSQYVRAAVKKGLKVRSFSGRQVLRRLEPAKAAAAAFLDEQVQRGRTLEQLMEAGIPAALAAAFEAMLRVGITPGEMPPS